MKPTSPRLPEVMGAAGRTTLHDGREVRVVQLNNAATTPPFVHTMQVLQDFLLSYGALHRGAGPRARLTVDAVERATESIRRFLKVPEDHAIIFTQNTSAAVNVLARMRNLGPGDVVAISEIEHTSNALPWRFNTRAEVVQIRADASGALDLDHLEQVARHLDRRLKLVAITGASNLTGYVTDVRRVAELAHTVGAEVFIDAAQLAPHRPIDMLGDRLDMLAFSAHKLYAPFGLGVLVVPRTLLETPPIDPGGGSIDMISDREIGWAPPGERHQTGTWNAAGIVALGASCAAMDEAGWEHILDHERHLVEYSARALARVDGLKMHVAPHLYAEQRRIGAFPFSFDGYHHALLTGILEHEHGMELRAGTICNHRLVRRWFGLSDEEQCKVEREIKHGNRLASYGVARASLGIHNTTEDVDALVEALQSVRRDGPKLRYRAVPERELYEPLSDAGQTP